MTNFDIKIEFCCFYHPWKPKLKHAQKFDEHFSTKMNSFCLHFKLNKYKNATKLIIIGLELKVLLLIYVLLTSITWLEFWTVFLLKYTGECTEGCYKKILFRKVQIVDHYKFQLNFQKFSFPKHKTKLKCFSPTSP